MIFFCFLLIVSIYLVSASFSGGMGTFVNFDSILIVLIGFTISSIAVSSGRLKVLLRGLGLIFLFPVAREANSEVRDMLKAISIMTLATGLCSTAQGLISGFLIESDAYSSTQKICFASFTLVYSVIFVCFLLVPVMYLNSGEKA